MSEGNGEGKARFWSVSNEDAAYTKHCIHHFILAKKLGVPPQLAEQDMRRLSLMWQMQDDIQEAEYKQLWREVEREITNGQ